MKPIEKIQRRIRKFMPILRDKYSVTELGVFGSYARGDQKSDSDLDILVSFEEAPSLFTFIELENFLSDRLDVDVDLVMRKALKHNLQKPILNEVIPV